MYMCVWLVNHHSSINEYAIDADVRGAGKSDHVAKAGPRESNQGLIHPELALTN